MKLIFTSCILLLCLSSQAQQFKTSSYEEIEYSDQLPDESWNLIADEITISFVSTNSRFSKNSVPSLPVKTSAWNAKAWRGEKVHTQILISTKRSLKDVNIEIKEQAGKKKNEIDLHILAYFVRYVLTDGLNSSGGGCGIQPGQDSSLVADVLDHTRNLDVASFSSQPVWVTIEVPTALPVGVYHASLSIKEGSAILKELSITIEVLDHLLPIAKQWRYHLDLWQNPYAIAREHKVEVWSKEHMKVMRPYMERLANAGQKAITASIIYDPWNGQTQDTYQSMIRWVKRKNGTWYYDYSKFDQWVSYMMRLGISKVINCYSLIPWNLKFYYFDEKSDKEMFIQAKPGTEEYDAHWRPMLIDFVSHLKEKKWFDRTAVAMDERPLDDMKKAIELIRSVDNDLKISLAGNFHAEITDMLFDYSVASNQFIDTETMDDRNKEGKITTYYTCCTEGFPNTFTFSPPAEATWLAWYSANKNYDGYLRWAYNCWPSNALRDSRFGTWSAGDAFLVYPGNRSSIRFERLVEGIQDFEKITILKEKFNREKNTDKLTRLNEILRVFEISALKTVSAAQMVDQAKLELNDLATN